MFWGSGILILFAAGLYFSIPFLPTVMRIHFKEAAEQARFEQLATAHGYSIGHWQNARGEIYVVVREISPRQFAALHAEAEGR